MHRGWANRVQGSTKSPLAIKRRWGKHTLFTSRGTNAAVTIDCARVANPAANASRTSLSRYASWKPIAKSDMISLNRSASGICASSSCVCPRGDRIGMGGGFIRREKRRKSPSVIARVATK